MIIGSLLSRRKSDEGHPYGHDRFESVTAVFTGRTGIEGLFGGSYLKKPFPGSLSIYAAVIFMIAKELLYRLPKPAPKRSIPLSCGSEASDQRAGIIAAAGALIGVLLTRFKVPSGDTAACLIGCAFITRTAYTVFVDAIEQLAARSCSAEQVHGLIGAVSPP